ncbi:PREDICTED: protein HESO1-like [Ipomoea nil]|uniref:protein HESO1-like n=1 Tax=Ipomoea nil TaxID=35883 RepID=UPI0009011299|nr:PREDICTED: protein HESO1-like [Ipomoea nil]XP_019168480.1 PREDICTED: protein HESO1-like [Ipomoea nil]
MSFTVEVLREEAAKCQRKTLLKYKIALEKSYGLDELLHGVCLVLFPKPSEYDARRDLVRIINEIVKEIYGCSGDFPCVVEFGSFTMDLFEAKSDLDLSVNFRKVDITRARKIQTLKKLAKKLYILQRSGHVYGVNPITRAIVPVLKVVDSGTGIECDISVGNRDGILKSKILYFISLIDERFRKLCYLMKAWAKAHNINSARDKTLNSLSIILLVAFHLQTRNHPILPPFSAILTDGCDTEAVSNSIHKFNNYGQNNTESVAELFVTLLLMLSSVDELWFQGLCVSTYEGSWISKTWDNKVGCIKVEDFTDRSQNVARAVGESEMKRINECVNLSIERISDFLSCRMEGYALREFLFGKDVAISVSGVTVNCNANVAKSNAPLGLTTWREVNDTMGGHKAPRQTRNVEHRGQSASPSPYHTALGKRTRTDGPTNTKRMRNTGDFGQMHYSETARAPYPPIPIAHPTYASNAGNWLSSDYVRESVIATPLVHTPMVYHPGHPHDQLQRTFRPPNFPTPSVYPTFPPITNQMFPGHPSQTLRVANLPSASDLLPYPLAGPNCFNL